MQGFRPESLFFFAPDGDMLAGLSVQLWISCQNGTALRNGKTIVRTGNPCGTGYRLVEM